jgi:hypothetical protein
MLTRVLRLPVAARSTEGPSENIRLIEEGDAQIGVVTMGVALQGLERHRRLDRRPGVPRHARDDPDVRQATPIHRYDR